MKVSLNWVKEFLDFELPPIDELVDKIGAQLGAVEEVVDLGAKYQGIVVAKVVACEKHGDADKLSVCLIDDGGVVKDVARDSNGHVQVVCGAPNVRTGLTVAWLPPGATVPATFGREPLVLEARDIRGAKSNGMLASPKELALSDNHEGILELDAGRPGDDFAKTYQLDDYIIDIENKMFTHRPDCFGQLGIAREVAGLLGQTFKSPDWYQLSAELPKAQNQQLKLSFLNELPALTPRFVAVAISGVKVGPSPLQLQTWLSRLGIRPINNVVDVTNALMLLTGQPLHAYDYDQVKHLSGGDSAAIVVRNPKPGEKLKLLNGKEIEPRADAIMIATEHGLLGLGGVMGGASCEVDEHSQNIILESANFDMYSIRRTSMAHGLFTDAVSRFNKGQSPLQNLAVAVQAVAELTDLTGGQLSGNVIDGNHVDRTTLSRGSLHPPVSLPVDFINERLGASLSAAEAAQLLTNVEFKIETKDNELTVTAPFWRTDIELREDVVEEVGRLYGYGRLPLDLPNRDITPAARDALLELKDKVRAVLARAGANEVLTYSFVHGELLQKAGQDPAAAFQLSNALSPDLQYYRLSLTPSLLEKVHPNIKAGYDQFALFEIGKGHNLNQKDADNLPAEFEMLDLVFAASDKAQLSGAAFYQAKAFLVNLAEAFNLELEFRPFAAEEDYPVVKPYDHRRSAQVFVGGTNQPLGMVGEYKASVARNLKLPKYCAGFGIGLGQLLAAASTAPPRYHQLPRFPKVIQDMTLKVKGELLFKDLYDEAQAALEKLKPTNCLATLTPLDIYQPAKDADHKQVTLRLSIASYERTLTDQEVNQLLDQVAAAAKTKFGAERI